MNPNETVTDDQDRPWSLGRTVARGAWFRSWHAEGPEGRKALLVTPLGSADLGGSDELAAACRAAVQEVASGQRERGRPEILGKVPLDDAGAIGVLIPMAASLQQRITAGSTLLDSLAAVRRAAVLLEGQIHGDLHPDTLQVLPQEGEEPEVRFGLAVPTSLARHLPELDRLAHHTGWRPPEAQRPQPSWDTWALCRMLWLAAATPPGDASARVELPEPGPDKVLLSTLKDRAMARLAHDQSNPRFRARVADRLAALLNRGLSREWEPSPPYRFSQTGPLVERLSDVMNLINPHVTDVGRIMLGDGTASGTDVFESGSPVKVAVSVDCSHGQTDHEDLVAGLRLIDQDAPGDGRVPLGGAKFAVRSHPSGRLRFEFTLPDVAPGRYEVRCAFAVKDSGDEPKVAEGAFQVRPAPGYVPPAKPVEKAPLELGAGALAVPHPTSDEDDEDGDDPDDAPTVQMDVATLRKALEGIDAPSEDAAVAQVDDGAELIEGFFPKPVAPPTEPLPRPIAAPVAPPTEPPSTPNADVHTFPGAQSPRDAGHVAPAVEYGTDGQRVPPAPLAAVPTPPPTEPSTHGDATVPRGSVSTPADTVPGDFADATDGVEAPSLGSAWMAAGEGDDDPYGEWNGGADALYGQAVPGDPTADLPTEDLPTYEEGGPRTDLVSKLKETLFRDTTTAVGVATAASLLLVLAIILLLKVL